MKPEDLSSDVKSLVGEIGNEIHKTIKVENIVTSKRSLQIGPWVFVVTHIIISSGIFIGASLHHQSRCILWPYLHQKGSEVYHALF